MGIAKVSRLIVLLRGRQVMFDADLARLYGVLPKRLNEQVRRNKERFPEDFMFRLTPQEESDLKSQIATSSGWGGRRKGTYAFTQEGVAMLSSVLKSEAAVHVNIAIMRAFVSLRRAVAVRPETARLERVEQKVDAHEVELGEHEARLNEVFAAMRRRRIG